MIKKIKKKEQFKKKKLFIFHIFLKLFKKKQFSSGLK